MAKQEIKYESTQVPAEKSVGEVANLIREYGGTRFEQVWGEAPPGRILGVRFAMRHPEIGELPVAMTARTGEIERILADAGYIRGKGARQERIERQAEKIAWRHIKDLTEQLLLSVRLGIRSLPAAFMADIEALDEATGETVTMYELFERRSELSSSGRGVELTASRRPSDVIALPPAAGKEDARG